MNKYEVEIKLPSESLKFVPHRETMLLVDELLEYTTGNIKGKTLIKKDNPFLHDSGIMGRNCLVEIMAQTVAAGNGYNAMVRGDTLKTGFLVGVNDFTFFENVRVGDELLVLTNEDSTFGDFTMVQGNISRGKELIARGNLKLYEIAGAPVKPEGTPSEAPETNKGSGGPITPSTNSPFFRAIRESSANFNIHESGAGAEADFIFKEDFIGFKGHFPGFPILPGVVMLETVMALAESLCGKKLKSERITKIKFSRQCYPGELLNAQVSMTYADDLWRINAKLSCGGSPVSSLTALAAPGDF